MTKNEFIFSNKPAHRITRHLVFWIIYCTFFWLQSFAPRKYSELYNSDTYYFAFLNLCCFGPVFIFLVYFFIYYLLPFLRQKRYTLFLFYFLVSYLVGTFINYYTADIFLNSVDYSIPVEPNFQHRMEFGNYNTRWGMIIAIIALGIKLSKDWYLQQKENLDILTRKTRAQMQLQKARIHPDLLFRSLDTIHSSIQAGSCNSSSMILNLSDLLSYSLYESEARYVPLERELSEVQHFISLENLNQEYLIKTRVQSEGELSNKFIAPLTIVKLVEESIALLHQSGSISTNISLGITISHTHLTLTLSFSEWNNTFTKALPVLIGTIQKRLDEHYATKDYQIEFIGENKDTAIKLKLKLSNSGRLNEFYETVNTAVYESS